ncbi:hypothetical protein H2200_011395 [Cladophialophora chaetospira]|uniref:F-box domain-containing protein n=1 Tax=Cladophialophora chaetospira TaxID=386627 RepID=A0AA38WZ99_9EURO|nr:hypothetical protein H2200_011395 [Cladophialophora chaetospira]
MRPPNARKVATRVNRRDEAPTAFRLLDLPGEMRLQIFSYYAYAHKTVLPEDDRVQTRRHAATMEAKRQDILASKKTRISLLSVSHQVSKEWAPIFYRTTTVLINPPGNDLDTPLSSDSGANYWAQVEVGEFRRIFLSKANSRLRYVTKIKFVVYPGTYRAGPQTEAALQSLIAILQGHYLQLLSLRKVTLQAINHCWPRHVAITDSDKGDMANSFKRVMGTSVTHLEQQLALVGSRNGMWSLVRKMKYGDSRALPHIRYWDWKALKIICRREHGWC